MRTPFLHAVITALALVVADARTAAAQSSRPPAAGAAWLVYTGDHAVASRLALIGDVQFRMAGDLDSLRQLLVRPGIAYALTPSLRVGAGYAYVLTASADELGAFRFPEHRVWEQLQLAHGLAGSAVTHRLRLEQRAIRTGRAGAPWADAERVRYQARVAVPVAPRLYVAAADELFASFGGDAGGFDVDQNRASLGIGVRASPTLRLEMLYLNQAIAAPGGPLAVRAHVLQLTVASSMALR